jgi:hypothetical protein
MVASCKNWNSLSHHQYTRVIIANLFINIDRIMYQKQQKNLSIVLLEKKGTTFVSTYEHVNNTRDVKAPLASKEKAIVDSMWWQKQLEPKFLNLINYSVH